MRVLFVSAMTSSHLFPLVPTAWALIAAGHEVRVAHQPAQAEQVMRAGLTSVVVGPQVRPDTNEVKGGMAAFRAGKGNESLFHERKAHGFFTQVAGAMVDDVTAFARHWEPDLIIYDNQSYAGHIAARVTEVPAVRHLFGPDFSAGVPGWREMVGEVLAPLYSSYDVDEHPDDVTTIDPCPPVTQFDLPEARVNLPVRSVVYNGPGMVHEWMMEKRARPRIAITLGTTYPWLVGGLGPIQRVIEALDGQDVELVAAVPGGSVGMLGRVPDFVRVLEDMPLRLFLPLCDTFISHAGDGSVVSALRSGVPQIFSPERYSGGPSRHNAERLVAAGAGARLEVEDASDNEIREVVQGVLDDQSVLRSGTERINRAIEERPAPAELVGRLEALA